MIVYGVGYGKISLLGVVAQLARALPWHGRGRGFEPLQLHQRKRFITSH